MCDKGVPRINPPFIIAAPVTPRDPPCDPPCTPCMCAIETPEILLGIVPKLNRAELKLKLKAKPSQVKCFYNSFHRNACHSYETSIILYYIEQVLHG